MPVIYTLYIELLCIIIYIHNNTIYLCYYVHMLGIYCAAQNPKSYTHSICMVNSKSKGAK